MYVCMYVCTKFSKNCQSSRIAVNVSGQTRVWKQKQGFVKFDVIIISLSDIIAGRSERLLLRQWQALKNRAEQISFGIFQ